MRRRDVLRAAGALAGAALVPRAAGAATLPKLLPAVRRAVFPIGTHSALDNPRFQFRGTGFAIGDGRTVVTAAHVVPEIQPDRTTALLLPRSNAEPATMPRPGASAQADAPGTPAAGADGAFEWRRLETLTLDREHDVALLRLVDPLPALPTIALAPAEPAAAEGQPVALVGFPLGGMLGFVPVTHGGIVASVVPIVMPPPNASRLDAATVARIRRGGAFEILQLDAIAYPGNSGGPLIDAESGAVVGIISMTLVKGARESAIGQPTGISYAIPVRFVHALLARR